MEQKELFPIVALIISVVSSFYFAIGKEKKISWVIPTIFSLLFFIVSIQTIVSEGPYGFWIEHTRNLWGNQIWFDLLLSIVAAIYFTIPQAKSLGMNIFFWVLFIFATGSVGLYIYISRIIYLSSIKK
jgi:sorbitol-specific phosphotransferase system component IIBC